MFFISYKPARLLVKLSQSLTFINRPSQVLQWLASKLGFRQNTSKGKQPYFLSDFLFFFKPTLFHVKEIKLFKSKIGFV